MSPTAKTADRAPRSSASRRTKKTAAPTSVMSAMSLHWSGDLDLTRAIDLHAELRDALAKTSSVELTLEAVGNMDLSCVQLLVSASRTATRDGKSFRVICAEPKVRELWQQAGLEAEFDQVVAESISTTEARS